MYKHEIHDIINQNRHHPYFGTIIYNASPPWIYHGSIQMNENVCLGWRALNDSGMYAIGEMSIWYPQWDNWSPGKWINYWSRDKIAAALHASVEIFHENWYYDFWKFNCEHWAQLMATGNCHSYQMDTWGRDILLKIGEFIKITMDLKMIPDDIGDRWPINKYAQQEIWNAVSNT